MRRIDAHHVELLPAELESSMRQAVMPDLARTISYMPERRMTFTRFREDIRTCLTKRRRRTHCEGIAVGQTN